VRSLIRFDEILAHRIYAGVDLLLMPSRYEPCGLAQMIAMRYGCVPLARSTGGLFDTISDVPDPAQQTGFLFEETTSLALSETIKRGLTVYNDRTAWRLIQNNGMKQNFSWEKSAAAYAKLYTQLRN
jgi:starch synthase